ncbi:hypothetical protein [Microcella humidisoli]|uniref:Lipoprotein n=1 Tax=Microcella humidisoli TaxID=2963406 RepID=A0ABY5FXH0_9MICO|nr:hypothetical protein [Microcella humidisoli]UTT62842.1 hypothetical protein NNL39_01640 [Microcella humidisoli]
MTRLRILATAALAVALLAGTTACAQVSEVLNPSTGEELVGTTWSGTDSDGDEWGIEFQQGGGVGLTFNDGVYDDDSDVWKVENGTIVIGIAFDTGIATLTGPYTRDATTIELEGEQDEFTWTLTLEKD